MRRLKKKEYEESIQKGNDRDIKLEEYIRAQRELKNEIEKQNEQKAKEEISKMRENSQLKETDSGE